MGFFSNLFGKRKKHFEETEEWEDIVYDHADVDFRQAEQGYEYIKSCVEQIEEATREVKLLTGEYTQVTSYLTDMEEIEALPEEQREEINNIARRMLSLEQERQQYLDKKNRMADTDYYRLRKLENEIVEGIQKLKECENYNVMIKQDLQKLDRERHAYEYRKRETYTIMNNLRGMALIFLLAFAVCMVMLLIMQFAFKMDVQVGYIIAALAVGIAVAFVGLRYADEEKELTRIEKAINKLILLQNKVKVRYVNNCNLMDYLYIKYSTDSSATLEKLWTKYLDEKEERKQFAEAEAKVEYYQKQLIAKLSNYRVVTPERWIKQPAALLDSREMVEIRHELIVRRQALRKQLDYNNKIAETAIGEIQDIARKYPAYGGEIASMLERVDGTEGRESAESTESTDSSY